MTIAYTHFIRPIWRFFKPFFILVALGAPIYAAGAFLLAMLPPIPVVTSLSVGLAVWFLLAILFGGDGEVG